MKFTLREWRIIRSHLDRNVEDERVVDRWIEYLTFWSYDEESTIEIQFTSDQQDIVWAAVSASPEGARTDER